MAEKSFLSYGRLAQRKRIAYNLNSSAEGCEVLCDPDYMELIVNNLLSNVLKYAGEDKGTTMILKEENHGLLLQIKDMGSGIPIDKQGEVSERLYQADNEHLGSSIGLSLVQRLMELHHRRIGLESEEGIGGTSSIYLPVEKSAYFPGEKLVESKSVEEQRVYTINNRDMYIIDTEGEEVSEGEVTPNETAAKDKQNKESILIVEDNLDIRQYLRGESGKTYHILKVESGEEALSIVKKRGVGLVLTGAIMPVMDGLQLYKQMRQNLRTCHIPVIILSTKTDLKEQLGGLQVGVDGCVPKPFPVAMIAIKIKNLFRIRYRTIEHYSDSLKVESEKVALNPSGRELLKKAVAIVEERVDSIEFSTEIFAREMCISRSDLHVEMEALTGESANDFIRRMRFGQACELLKEEKYTVSEISGMAGFNTPSCFATSFKKYFGCLPSKYGKQSFESH